MRKGLEDEFIDLRESNDGHDTAPIVSKAILKLLSIQTTLLILTVIHRFLAFIGTVSFVFFTYMCESYYNESEAPWR